MMEVAKEDLCINKLITEKTEIIFVEGDMIVPDSKPDILNTICTSGVVCIYKRELQEGKMRIDGGVNSYIMYMPEGMDEGIRGVNTVLDFSHIIDLKDIMPDMQICLNVNVKSIEAKVINGRKIGIKAALEMYIKIFTKEQIEVVNDVVEKEDVQFLKDNFSMNSLLGTGSTKIYAKDTVQIDNIDQLAEVLKVSTNLIEKDAKISYNKVLTKAEAEIKIVYLTEDNRIGKINPKIPVVGFIDIPEVSEDNSCDIYYELRNMIVKPNAQEEHSIFVEMEYEVICNVYEEKNINLIQDLYKPDMIFKIDRIPVSTISGKTCVKQSKILQEIVSLKDIDGKKLVDVDSSIVMQKETKINSKILYEMEFEMRFLFLENNMQVSIREASIPFEYVIDNLERGESLNTRNDFEILSQDFVVQNDGNISCIVNMDVQTDMYRNVNVNLIQKVEEDKQRTEQDYSVVIYIVKKGDTLWNIAKEFGSTVDDIVKANEIENPNQIQVAQKLYIPKYIRIQTNRYA